ncbi:MAG: acyl-CoA dehydrogenase family protein [Rhizobacter sp.]
MSSDALQSLARAGLFKLGVPRSRGGDGADVRELVRAVAETSARDPAAVSTLVSQRLLIEVLLHSDNLGLSEYQLPRLLEGEIGGNCAALWPQGQGVVPALARDTGRHWRVNGDFATMPNLQGGWFLMSAPIRFEGSAGYSLVLLKSEEQGLDRLPSGALELRNVFLWEDEIIANDGAALVEKLRPLSHALGAAFAAGAGSHQALQPGLT